MLIHSWKLVLIGNESHLLTHIYVFHCATNAVLCVCGIYSISLKKILQAFSDS